MASTASGAAPTGRLTRAPGLVKTAATMAVMPLLSRQAGQLPRLGSLDQTVRRLGLEVRVGGL